MEELDGIEEAVRRVEGLIGEASGEEPQRLLVLIDGPAGSGKTTIATELAARTGATLVHMDSLYRGWNGLEAGSRIAAGLVGSLAGGESASFREWDWSLSSEGGEVMVSPAALLIVEGVGSASEAARGNAGLVVWVEADAELRYRRAIERDGEVFAAQWDAWAAQEAEHFEREATRASADCLINTGAV